MGCSLIYPFPDRANVHTAQNGTEWAGTAGKNGIKKDRPEPVSIETISRTERHPGSARASFRRHIRYRPEMHRKQHSE